MGPAPLLDDLIWFFECEPQGELQDWEAQWPYSEVSFSTKLALDLKRVVTVDVERLRSTEVLRVHFRDADPLDTLRLQLKLSFSLTWAIDESASASS